MIGTDMSIIDPVAGDKVPHGLVFGKFMPPTMGHMYLVDVARRSSQKLTIIVGTLPDEPIPGDLRYRWMKELFPDCHVVHLGIPMPQEPAYPEDTAFFKLWADTLYEYGGRVTFDALFASESYGYKVAEAMGIRFIPVDAARQSVQISATKIRQDPFTHWDMLPVPVRPYFVQRVCLSGGSVAERHELAQQLSAHFRTVYVRDAASVLLDDFRRHIDGYPAQLRPQDMLTAQRAQQASEAALARQARGILFTVTPVGGTATSDIVFDVGTGTAAIIADLSARFPALA